MKKFLMLLIGSLFIGMPICASAEESFNIKPHIPENQLDDRDDVLNLRVTDNTSQELLFDIVNDYSEEVTYSMIVSNASTTPSGQVDYLNINAVPSETMKNKLSDLLQVDTTVTVPANGKVTVKGVLSTGDSFDGIVMGALQLIKSGDSSSGISNNLAISVPILLTMNDKSLDAELLYKSTKAKVDVGNSILDVEIENPQPVIMPNMKLNYVVKHKGKMYTEGKSDITLAPNSIMNYTADLNGKKFAPGKYDISIKIKSDYGDWEWDDTFKVEKKEAKELNENIRKKPINWIKVSMITVVSLLVVTILFLGYKVRKLKK